MFSVVESQINTATGIANTFSEIDVENIFYHIKLDSTFIGAKFHDRYRGDKYSDTTKRKGCMFNQVTLPIVINNHEYNVKVFNGGKLQFSGVKGLEEIRLVTSVLMNTIKEVKGTNKIKLLFLDGVFYNEKEYNNFIGKKKTRFDSIKIYDTEKNVQFGERKEDDFILKNTGGGIECDVYDERLLVAKKFVKKSSTVIHKILFSKRTGKEIGFIEYTFLFKTRMIDTDKYIFKKKDVMQNDALQNEVSRDTILYKYTGQVIGEKRVVVDFEQNSDEIQKYIYIDYCGVKSLDDCEYSYDLSNINGGFKLLFNNNKVFLNRVTLNNIFIEKMNLKSECELDGGYPAVKLTLEFDENGVLKSGAKYKNKISIFENGSTLTFSSKSLFQVRKVVQVFIDLMNEVHRVYGSCILRQEKPIVEIKDPNLQIYDIL